MLCIYRINAQNYKKLHLHRSEMKIQNIRVIVASYPAYKQTNKHRRNHNQTNIYMYNPSSTQWEKFDEVISRVDKKP